MQTKENAIDVTLVSAVIVVCTRIRTVLTKDFANTSVRLKTH